MNAAINVCRLRIIKVGRDTPEVTDVENRALPAGATLVAEAGNLRL